MPASPPPSGLHDPVTTVGIVARPHSTNATAAVREAVAWLEDRPVRVVLEHDTALRAGIPTVSTATRDDLAAAVDVLLVLGGDGTLLSVAHPVACGAPDTPILAVNCGSLGFLTEVTLPEMRDALASVLDGRAGIDERRMLRARVERAGRVVADRLILNDVVVGKSARSDIIDVSITVRDQFVISSRADGVIVATPTGSTAYNLAAGGPIVHPTVDAVVVTPIAPHTLTNRPIVLADTAPVTITPNLSGPRREAAASFDGQYSVDLEPDDVVVVERAPHPLRVVRSESRSYFAVLRQKLKWGER